MHAGGIGLSWNFYHEKKVTMLTGVNRLQTTCSHTFPIFKQNKIQTIVKLIFIIVDISKIKVEPAMLQLH